MSIQALNWVMEQNNIKNSGAKFVLMILCNYADEHGVCYPSRETIAEKTGFKIRAVQNHLNWLVENGYIAKAHRRFNHKISSNSYQILFISETKNIENLSAKNDKKHSADYAPCKNSLVQKTTELSAKNDKKHSADYAPYTKAYKEDTKEKDTQDAQTRETEKPVRVPESVFKPSLQKLTQNGNSPSFGQFRDEIEDWWCEIHGVITLPPDHKTAENLSWLYENKFSVLDIRQFYDFATNDPEQKSWRRGNVTLGAIVKGIAGWKTEKSAITSEADKPPSAIQLCKLCDERGLIEIQVEGNKRLTKCSHRS